MMGTWVSYLDEKQPLEGYLAAPDWARDMTGRPSCAQLAQCQRVDM